MTKARNDTASAGRVANSEAPWGVPSVRGRSPMTTPADDSGWGMVVNPQGGQFPGEHKAQPLLETWRWVRAQIGTRPVQQIARGDAGQSAGQLSGMLGKGHSRQMIDEGPFFYGPEVVKIMRFFRTANNGYGGYNTIGRAAFGITGGTGDNFTVLKRPLMRFPTRGPRSISGAMNRKSRWDDTGRVPSVFTPTTPLR
jgi:hypothetical protein